MKMYIPSDMGLKEDIPNKYPLYKVYTWGWLLKVPSQGFSHDFSYDMLVSSCFFPGKTRVLFGTFHLRTKTGEHLVGKGGDAPSERSVGVSRDLGWVAVYVFFWYFFKDVFLLLLFLFCFFWFDVFFWSWIKKIFLDRSSHRVYTGEILVGFLKTAPFMWVLMESTTRMLGGFYRKPVQLNEKRFTGILLLAVLLPFCRGHQISNNA